MYYMPVSADIIDIIYRTTGPTTPVLLVPSFVTNPEILEIDTPKQKPELVLVLVISVASTIADIVKCYMVYRERELKEHQNLLKPSKGTTKGVTNPVVKESNRENATCGIQE